MAQDSKIISSLSPAEFVVLLRETADIAVLESAVADGKPVIHAAVKAVNAQTGEVLPGALPFSVVMFKSGNDVGYTNIAIGTVVPAAELDIHLPRDYFNFCNQRLRFMRVFPLDAGSFVIQMDLVLRHTTREYVKFNIGLWSVLFKQVLYELIGRGRDSLVHAAEVYAATAQHYVATGQSMEGLASAEPSGPDAEAVAEAETPQTLPEAAILPAATPAEAVQETAEEVLPIETVAAVPDEVALMPDRPLAEAQGFEPRSENVMMLADPVEGKDEPFAVTLLDGPAEAVASGPAAEDEKVEPS